MDKTPDFQDPFLEITESDRGGTVVLASLISIILSGSVVAIALGARIKSLKTLILSDWLLVVATIFSVVQSVCICMACRYGLGRHLEALNDAQYMAYSKFVYASQILTLLSLSTAKLSAAHLIITIQPFRKLWIACVTVIVVVGAWTVAGVISLAAQCDLPQPWHFEAERCVDQWALYLGLGVISIVTDIALVVVPIILVHQVQLSVSKRITTTALFSSRVILPTLTILTLVRMEAFVKSTNKPWDAVQPSIWMQATLGLSLVTTCIPNLKRVLDHLQIGLMAGTISEFHELSRPADTAAYGYATGLQTDWRSARRLSGGQSKAKESGPVGDYLRPDYAATKGHGFVNSIIGGKKDSRDNSHGGSESVENLTRYGITQTIAFEVRYGDRPETSTGDNQTGASCAASSETRID